MEWLSGLESRFDPCLVVTKEGVVFGLVHLQCFPQVLCVSLDNVIGPGLGTFSWGSDPSRILCQLLSWMRGFAFIW